MIIVVNVIELMVYWSLISNLWNHKRDDAYPSHDSWTARYGWSCINKLHIVNHFCMVTIIGQIKPWGSLETRTTRFIKRMEWVLSSLWVLIELGDIGVCREMICDIAKGSVNCSSSARCHICTSRYTGRDTWKQHRDNSKNTLEQNSNAIYQGNLEFNFLSLWVQ